MTLDIPKSAVCLLVIACLWIAVGCAAGGSAAPCAPACRNGFACVSHECVATCSPACEPGLVCTRAGECTAPTDGGVDGTPDDSATSDATLDTGALDGSTDSAVSETGIADGGTMDSGTRPACTGGEVVCGGSCVAPVLPQAGARTPTEGHWNSDWFDNGAMAVNPCTGDVGLAYAQQVMGGDNWEVFATVVAAALGDSPSTPVRITAAPGAASEVAISWMGDGFGIFWADPRHDPAPEACTRCLRELYYAAIDASGAVVTPEVRLTTHASDYIVSETIAAWSDMTGEMGVAWADADGSRQVHGAIVSPEGVMRAEQEVSAAVSPNRGGRPRLVWNDDAWQFLFVDDDPSGGRPDYLHARRMDVAGVLGADLNLRVPAEQIALTTRGAFGYATITQGGSPRELRLWDLGWSTTTTLPSTAATNDGSRGFAWDGDNLYVTNTTAIFEIIRLNALGVETGRIPLTTDSLMRAASHIHMAPVGSRLVVEWVWSTGGLGPIAHHQVQVVESTSAM